MALSSEEIAEIVQVLPEVQRAEARKALLTASHAGWTKLAIWTWFRGRENRADIVGFKPPNEKGERVFSFLHLTHIEKNLRRRK